jgi:hypothetical protein
MFYFDQLLDYLQQGDEFKAREYIKAHSGFTYDSDLDCYQVYGLDWNGLKINLGLANNLDQCIQMYNDHVIRFFGSYALIKQH